MKVQKYTDLRVWVEGIDLAEEVYGVTEGFSRREWYGLASQLRKSAVSIPSSIAEGYARFGTKEFHRYVTIALGSLAELETQMEPARSLDYVGGKAATALEKKSDRPGRQLQCLRKRLGTGVLWLVTGAW